MPNIRQYIITNRSIQSATLIHYLSSSSIAFRQRCFCAFFTAAITDIPVSRL